MNPRLITLAFLSAIAMAPAHAQIMRPGLWEVNNKVAGGAAPEMQAMAKAQQQNMEAMRAQMDKLPPEQRKSMEAMMSKMGQGSKFLDKDGMTIKVCVTPEMAAQNQLTEHHRGSCTNKRSPVVGGVMKVSYVCTKPPSTGEGTVTLQGDTGYTMDMTMRITQGGRSMDTSMASRGKWLGMSCGDVKPPVMPKEYK